MSRRSALITGGAGFLGRHFADELERTGWDVLTIDILPGPDIPFFPLGDAPLTTRLHIVQDFTVFTSRGKKWLGPETCFDLVIHCAATAPHRAAIDGNPGNLALDVQLDATVFEWAVRTRQHRVLYVSSSAVYPVDYQTKHNGGRRMIETDQVPGSDLTYVPDGNYGWTKYLGELMAEQTRHAGVPVTVVRPFSGYGEDQGSDWPFGAFIRRVHDRVNPFPIWGDPNQMRDWIHVSDVVTGALAVAESEDSHPVNLCTGDGTSMLGLVRLMARECDPPYDPAILPRPDAPAGVFHRVGDPARMLTYYTPQVSLEEGVARAFTSE